MRVWRLWGVGLWVLAFSLLGRATCNHQIYGNAELNRTTLSIPTTIIAKVLRAIDLDIEVTIEFNAAMEFRLDCDCNPCCRDPEEKQVASLTVFASVRALGGTVVFAGAASEVRDGVPHPVPGEPCGLPVTLAYEKGDRLSAIGVGISVFGATIKTQEVKMSFSATPHCGCTDNPLCFGNTAPVIVDVSPPSVDLKKGESATITVTAVDAQNNLDHFSEPAEGPGYLPGKLITVQYEGGARGVARYRIDFPAEGEELQGLFRIAVWDKCGQSDGTNVPVRLLYPPVITPDPGWGSRWYDGEHRAFFSIYDLSFRGRPKSWEEVPTAL